MFSTKIFILLACSLAIAVATPVNDDHPGGKKKLTDAEIVQVKGELQVTLDHLASGGDDAPHYTVFKINSATLQIVAGDLYELNVDFVDAKGVTRNCDVVIWSRSWILNGIVTSIKCVGEEPVEVKRSA